MKKELSLTPFNREEVVTLNTSELTEGLKLMNATTMWEKGFYGEGVKIAVIDTGIDYNHLDFRGAKISGKSFVDYTSDYMDDNGHGTHVAGTIIAQHNNVGVMGIAPKAEVLALKVLDYMGYGKNEWVTKAILYAIEQKVDIISMSLGGPYYNKNQHEAILKAIDAGIIVISAAGNSGDNNDTTDEWAYPANLFEVVTVGALNNANTLAPYSNTSTYVDISALGTKVLSTTPQGCYEIFSGTSMATPHVSGAIALILEQFRKEYERDALEPEKYANLVKHTKTLPNIHRKGQGAGMIYFTQKTKITMMMGSKDYTLNGEDKQMDVAPFIKDGRTFVPVRFVSEGLGAKVTWRSEDRQVLIED